LYTEIPHKIINIAIIAIIAIIVITAVVDIKSPLEAPLGKR
jgi:hypothetical protein